MDYYNVYELLYMYHTGCAYAGTLMENTVKKMLCNWVHEKLKIYCRGNLFYFDDLYQEACLAMYEAMNSYRDDKQASFITYLKIVVDSRLKNACRDLFLKKNCGLLKCISLDALIDECDDSIIGMESQDVLSSPEYKLHFNECREHLDEAIGEMSVTEKKVMYAWIDGESYVSAANKLNINKKAYDGKLQKVRKKIRLYCNKQNS